MNDRISSLQQELAPLREKLFKHPVYSAVQDLQGLRIFMKHHVFAVWDFMSLLKSLQQRLTCTTVPWLPVGAPSTRFFINEIVIGEESDVDHKGDRASHFELYLMAMEQAKCDMQPIQSFISELMNGAAVTVALQQPAIPDAVRKFTGTTFEILGAAHLHTIASAFTFGREDLIPGMFISFVKVLNEQKNNTIGIFQYYLERHIEVDGDHHSHLAFGMMQDLCKDDDRLWQEATLAAKKALEARIALWDAIHEQITQKNKHLTAI